jgi:hypothetical protein
VIFGKKILLPSSGYKSYPVSSNVYAITSQMVILFTFSVVRTLNKTVHKKVD